MTSKTLGQVGYDAYGAHAEWKAYNGLPMPRWEDPLRDDIKEKWSVAAKAIVETTAQTCAPAIVKSLISAMVGDDGKMSDELVSMWEVLVVEAIKRNSVY